jgi:hypothetical protein
MSRQATWVSTFHVSVEFLKQVIFQTLKESLGSNDEASLCLIYWEPVLVESRQKLECRCSLFTKAVQAGLGLESKTLHASRHDKGYKTKHFKPN